VRHTIDDINLLATMTLGHVDINSELFTTFASQISQRVDLYKRKLAALPGVITVKTTDKQIDI
jgi:hypothetical protein